MSILDQAKQFATSKRWMKVLRVDGEFMSPPGPGVTTEYIQPQAAFDAYKRVRTAFLTTRRIARTLATMVEKERHHTKMAVRIKEQVVARSGQLEDEIDRLEAELSKAVEQRTHLETILRQKAPLPDQLHPMGRCCCNGEGWCLFCQWVAVSEERDRLLEKPGP